MSKVNGYPIVYMPDRDDVIGSSGCVYEHILVAESILGRRLLPGEVEHHKDKNRSNNSPENIMVFKTNADHARFHATGTALLDGDVYVSPEVKNFCIDCGKEIGLHSTRCAKCLLVFRSRNTESNLIKNKDIIYEMALSGKKVKEIAECFNLLPGSFSRICRRLGIVYKIPKPPKEKKTPHVSKKVKRTNIENSESVTFNNISEAAKAINKPDTHIRDVCSGKRKSAYGYYWNYVD